MALSTSVEPYAAATAAVHWLRRAALHVADVAGQRVDDVVALAEAIAHEDLLVAREALVTRADRTAAELVRELLSEAVLAGRGVFVVCREHAPGGADDGPWRGPDDPWHGAEPGWLADDPDDGAGIAGETGHRVLRTVLDPLDPGRYLVDGLVRGIHGCFRGYVDETLARERPGDDRAADSGYLARLRDRFVTGLRTAGRPAGTRERGNAGTRCPGVPAASAQRGASRPARSSRRMLPTVTWPRHSRAAAGE